MRVQFPSAILGFLLALGVTGNTRGFGPRILRSNRRGSAYGTERDGTPLALIRLALKVQFLPVLLSMCRYANGEAR